MYIPVLTYSNLSLHFVQMLNDLISSHYYSRTPKMHARFEDNTLHNVLDKEDSKNDAVACECPTRQHAINRLPEDRMPSLHNHA